MLGRMMILGLLCVLALPVQALDLKLSVQPVLPRDQIVKAYQPLADYLSKKTGQQIRIQAHINFLAYWASARQPSTNQLALDAAPFVDYRVQRQNFEVLAKLPDSVSFSIVTSEDDLIFDLDELVLKRVATMVSPSIGALRLHSLFPNPMRQPRIIYARDANDAARMVAEKRAFAAIIPTALVSSYEGLNTVMTTDALPHMGLSASADIPSEIRQAIQQALVNANKDPEGQAMLAKLNFVGFERADNALYRGYVDLLKNEMGF